MTRRRRRKPDRLEVLAGLFTLRWLRSIQIAKNSHSVTTTEDNGGAETQQVRDFIQLSLNPRVLQSLLNLLRNNFQNHVFKADHFEPSSLLHFVLHDAATSLDFEPGVSAATFEKSLSCFDGKRLIALRIPNSEGPLSEILSYNLGGLASLRHLTLSGCQGVGDSTLSSMGRHCHQLQVLCLDDCANVTDAGLQSLVFPPSVLRKGEVNLAAAARRSSAITNPLAKKLRCLDLCGTSVGVTGCVIALQYLPRVSRPEGRLRHGAVGDALAYLTRLIGPRCWDIEELYDSSPTKAKLGRFSEILNRSMFNAYRVAITSPSELEVLVHSEEAWIPNLHHLWLQLKSEEIAITSEAIARLAGPYLRTLALRGCGASCCHLDLALVAEKSPHLIHIESDLPAHCSEGMHRLANLRTAKLAFDSEECLKAFLSFGLTLLTVLELDLSLINSDERLFHWCEGGYWLPSLERLRLKKPLNRRHSYSPTDTKVLLCLLRQFPELHKFGPLEHWMVSTSDVGSEGEAETLAAILCHARDVNWDLVIECRGVLYSYDATSGDAFDPWRYRYVPDTGRRIKTSPDNEFVEWKAEHFRKTLDAVDEEAMPCEMVEPCEIDINTNELKSDMKVESDGEEPNTESCPDLTLDGPTTCITDEKSDNSASISDITPTSTKLEEETAYSFGGGHESDCNTFDVKDQESQLEEDNHADDQTTNPSSFELTFCQLGHCMCKQKSHFGYDQAFERALASEVERQWTKPKDESTVKEVKPKRPRQRMLNIEESPSTPRELKPTAPMLSFDRPNVMETAQRLQRNAKREHEASKSNRFVMRTSCASSLVAKRMQKDYELSKIAKVRKKWTERLEEREK